MVCRDTIRPASNRNTEISWSNVGGQVRLGNAMGLQDSDTFDLPEKIEKRLTMSEAVFKGKNRPC